jgi:hypothetical protein
VQVKCGSLYLLASAALKVLFRAAVRIGRSIDKADGYSEVGRDCNRQLVVHLVASNLCMNGWRAHRIEVRHFLSVKGNTLGGYTPFKCVGFERAAELKS